MKQLHNLDYQEVEELVDNENSIDYVEEFDSD